MFGETATATPSPPAAAVSPSPTPSPEASASETPSGPQPDATPASSRGPNRIEQVVAAPNPDPREILVRLEGAVDQVQIRIYATSMVLVAEASVGASPAGWVRIPLPAGFLQRAAKGVYYVRAQAFRGGESSANTVIGRFVIL